jgi:hypothetical protein
MICSGFKPRLLSAHHSGGDLVIGAAAADIAVHALQRLLAAQETACILDHLGRCHDLPRLAVAALRGLLGNPGRLQSLAFFSLCQAFDRGDLRARSASHWCDAGALRRAVDMHGTRAALGDATAILGARKVEVFAQYPEQGLVGGGVGGHGFTVERKTDHAGLQNLSSVQ